MAHSSTFLDASKKWLFTGTYSINKASEWLWLEHQEAPQTGQNVHGLQVRTPIRHIVPVSRTYNPPSKRECPRVNLISSKAKVISPKVNVISLKVNF